MFIQSLYFFNDFIQSSYLLLGAEFFACIAKLYLLIALILKGFKSRKTHRPLFFLCGVLVGGLFVDFTWLVKLTRILLYPAMDYRLVLFFIRLSWAISLIQFQSLGLLLESLGEQSYKIKIHQKILFLLNSILMGCFVFIGFYYFNQVTRETRPQFEFDLMNFGTIYMLLIFVLPSLFLTIKKLKNYPFPKILRRQLVLLIKYLICPYIITEVIQAIFISSKMPVYAVTSLSVSLLTFALYYSTRKVMGLRFLNFQNHVQSYRQFNFIDDFKNLLEQLSQVTNIKELGHISQTFFKDAFKVAPARVSLHLRNFEFQGNFNDHEISFIEKAIENFINRHTIDSAISEYIRRHRILITDEIVFSNFYEENRCLKELAIFLEHINVDIFLPIFEHQTIIAYIIVERYARPEEFYSDVERDEMLVFASYLSNIINLLQNRNLNSLIEREKELKHELYNKHQEINQYKESMRSFLRDIQERKIGIIFYKNRRFIFANQAAQDLIDVNINNLEGHPLTKALRQTAQKAQEYKTHQVCFTQDVQGNRLVLSALPHIEHNNVIIVVHYPEIADIIKRHVDVLHNPSEWDYLLYLETTKTGMLINQLIPGFGGALLNYKIELLKAALSNKALLLDMPDDDLLPTVEVLHHINLRQILHTIVLQAPVKNFDVAIKLFGINPIFGLSKEAPLLESLSLTGTIFIQNIHYLDLETQHYLAEYLKYGHCHVFKSDKKISSSVRVICSTNQNLSMLVQEGKFSAALYNELYKMTLSMPSLINLSFEELQELAEGFSQQAVSSSAFANLLSLSEKEKDKLAQHRPVSLQELKMKVQMILEQKSKKNNIQDEVHFDPAYYVTDPDLVDIARMGKKALKDSKVMALLWHKFKNQNKIASFLGVNRSSINRRCKKYNLT